MRRAVNSALLTVAAVPALLAVPVVGPLPEQPHPVAPTVVSVPLGGVDPQALAEGASAVAGASDVVSGDVSRGSSSSVAAASVAVRPAVLTPRRTTAPFDLVAVTWQEPADPGTRVRVRIREKGTWSPWQRLETDDEGPDDGSAEARAASGARDGTAPLLTDGADGVQVRVDTPGGKALPGLAVDLVDAGRSTADSATAYRGSAAEAATPRPGIVTRAQWGADERLVKAEPVVNQKVKTLVLHHTATTNSYTRATASAQVRAVYAFHTKRRGWNDIGYNFLVDRFGTVYEGRRGSLSSPVTGAHTGGFNGSSLGVSVLGTYTATNVPAATVRALAGLLSWQTAQYGINPRGTASVVSVGHTGSRFKAGATARVAGIVGHRDLGYTECPGKGLQGRLAGLRSTAAARMVPGLTDPRLSPPAVPAGTGSITFGAAIPTRQRWALTVTPFCGGATVRTVSGTSSDRITGTWDLKDSAGTPSRRVSTRSPWRRAPRSARSPPGRGTSRSSRPRTRPCPPPPRIPVRARA